MFFKNMFRNLLIDGNHYVYCSICLRYGKIGWGHKCGTNWYTSIYKLEEALKESKLLVGSIVKGS